MRMRKARIPAAAVVVLVSSLAGAGLLCAQEKPGDKGETAEAKKLRGRATAPTAADVDADVTLDAMLAKNDKAAFSESKGAKATGENDAHKWVIVEVTPAWQKKSAALSPEALRKLPGTRVRVTGWLYWEPDEEQGDPRGTRWEIHPVTAIAPAR